MDAYTRKRLLPMATAVVAALALTACGSSGPAKVETPSGITVELINPDKLTVCTTLPYAPFQFKDGKKVVGFDVDIVDLVADKLGVKQDIVDVRFDSIKSGAAMSGGTCDIGNGGMTITPEREKNIDFSDPYFDEVLAFMAPKGTKVETIEDVTDQDLTLGVQIATTSLDYAKEQGMDPEQYEGSAKELQALQSGTVDVVLQDLPVINEWLKNPDIADKFELGGIVTTGKQYGMGFTKGSDPALRKVFNEVLADAREDGTYDEIYEHWFGTKPAGS